MPEVDVQPKFDVFAERLLATVDEINARHMAQMRTKLPDWLLENEKLWEAAVEFGRASIEAELTAFRKGELPESCPEPDAATARESGRAGGLLTLMLSGYRSGHFAQWEAWMRLVETDEDLAAGERVALLERGGRFFFDYEERLTAFVTEEYMREQEQVQRSLEQRRVHAVREILDGRLADLAVLDYPVDGHHVGFIAWGEVDGESVRELARARDRRLLLVKVWEETWWGWLGGGSPVRAMDALASFQPPAGSGFAFGAEEEGPEGFVRTHHQALAGMKAGRSAGRPVVVYDEVALEDLTGSDPRAGKLFAARELRGIDGDGARDRRLRETLDAYFRHAQNAAATAAALGVHEQTVAQRIRAVEERTGRPVAARRAELEVALRLTRMLDSKAG